METPPALIGGGNLEAPISIEVAKVERKGGEEMISDVDKIHSQLLDIFSRQPKECKTRYAEERDQRYSFTIESGLDETSRNTREYIEQIVGMNQDIHEAEIIGLAMLMDVIDYGFACCLMFCPQSPEQVEKDVMKKDIYLVVNSLSEEFKVDPFSLEDSLRTRYQELNLHQQLHCVKILSAKIAAINNE